MTDNGYSKCVTENCCGSCSLFKEAAEQYNLSSNGDGDIVLRAINNGKIEKVEGQYMHSANDLAIGVYCDVTGKIMDVTDKRPLICQDGNKSYI